MPCINLKCQFHDLTSLILVYCWHSLAQLPSAMKFRSKYRSVRRNIVVTQTIGLPKYRRNNVPNESSLIFVEYSRNSSNFVCITFAQYCMWYARFAGPKLLNKSDSNYSTFACLSSLET